MAIRGEFSHLEEGGTGPTSGGFADTRVAAKAEVMLTDVDEIWLRGRLTGAMSLLGKEAGKERDAVVGTTDNSQNICKFYAREQRADGVCSFMNVNGFCKYAHMDTFERINKEKLKKEGRGQVKEAE